MFDKSGLMQLQIWIEIWPMGGRVPALPGCEVQTRNQRWWGGGDMLASTQAAGGGAPPPQSQFCQQT